MEKHKIGVIADDFTGASDAASFLVKAGNRTLLLTKLPKELKADCDCIVVALKIRSVEAEDAIAEVDKVIRFFKNNKIDQIYYKYCSTFDSTPKGNIGPVMDHLLQKSNEKYSLLCPALPVNGRTVEKGILYVDGVPLDESPLKNHPLNPMWDSYIPNLMKPQSQYPCFPVSKEEMASQEKLNEKIKRIDHYEHFYLVPDYSSDEDGELIYERFHHLPILSGGSGLLEYFKQSQQEQKNLHVDHSQQKAVILCGSCSARTNQQVQYFKKTMNPCYAIDARKILSKEITVDFFVNKIKENLPKTTLIYSDGCEGNLRRNSASFHDESKGMETFLSDLALRLRNDGFNKIIVAGGETSGAVTIQLGYHAFYVGESVAPGVPVLIPIEDPNVRIILKSGNFGDEQFFMKALEVE